MIGRDRERDLHALLDGSATPAEAAATEAWLATSSEGRQRRAELEALFAAVGTLRPEPVPADLRGGVMAAVRARGRATVRRAAPVRPRWAMLAPAAAVLIAAAAFPWWRHALQPQQLSEVTGSIATPAATPGQARWRIGGATVTVSVTRAPAGLSATFDVRSQAPVDLELAAGGTSLSPARLAAATGDPRLETAVSGLTVHAPGDTRFSLTLPGDPGRVTVTLSSGSRRSAVTLPTPAPGPTEPK